MWPWKSWNPVVHWIMVSILLSPTIKLRFKTLHIDSWWAACSFRLWFWVECLTRFGQVDVGGCCMSRGLKGTSQPLLNARSHKKNVPWVAVACQPGFWSKTHGTAQSQVLTHSQKQSGPSLQQEQIFIPQAIEVLQCFLTQHCCSKGRYTTDKTVISR